MLPPVLSLMKSSSFRPAENFFLVSGSSPVSSHQSSHVSQSSEYFTESRIWFRQHSRRNLPSGFISSRYSAVALFIASGADSPCSCHLCSPSNIQFRMPGSSFRSVTGRSLSCSDCSRVTVKGISFNLRQIASSVPSNLRLMVYSHQDCMAGIQTPKNPPAFCGP